LIAVVVALGLLVRLLLAWPCAFASCDPVPNNCQLPAAPLPPLTPPVVTSVEIVPAAVTLRGMPSTAVVLEARARDAEGFEIGEAYGLSLQWTSTPDVLTKSPSPPRLLRLALSATAGGGSVAVVATDPGTAVTSGTATVRYEPAPGVVAGSDRPRVAIADIRKTLQGPRLDPMAYVGDLELTGSHFWGNAWRAVLFLNPVGGPTVHRDPPRGARSRSELASLTETWTVDTKALQMASMSVQPMVRVPVAAWFAVSTLPGCGGAALSDHIAWATGAYQRARAGLSFFVSEDSDLDAEPEVAELVREYCETGDASLAPPGVEGDMNVYFVDVGGPFGGILDFPGGRRATACIPKQHITSLSVLAHELGHSLSLSHIFAPASQNPVTRNGDDPISALNVMSPYVVPTHDAPHDRLLLGQVFRVLLSDESWIPLRPALVSWTGIDCGTACPPVLLDLEVAK
jgi:hypothetical protein